MTLSSQSHTSLDHTQNSVNAHFKRRLNSGESVLGCFLKTPHPILVEVLGQSELDFLVLDAEHAPFDRAAIDQCMIAARAARCPVLVRIPDSSWILNVLDSGAAGVIVPHVKTPEQARQLAQAVHYGRDGRGFAGTTRAAAYAQRPLPVHRTETAAEVTLICQIEDPEGVDNVAAIASVEQVDALFIGRADLAVAYGLNDFFAPELAKRCAKLLATSGVQTGLYCAPGESMQRWKQAGATFFITGSEHALLIQGAKALRQHFMTEI